MVYIVMGVSGSGKTTIGKLLAQKLVLPFYDGDDFHSAANIAKMANGMALTDDDRREWLEILAKNIVIWEEQGGAILACSALKEKYREVLRSIPYDDIEWIFLKGSEEVIKQRLSYRKDHFMNTSLLHSQFEILEEPDYGIKVSVQESPEHVVQRLMQEVEKKANQ